MNTVDTIAVGLADGDQTHAERQFDPWRNPKTPAAERFVEFSIEMIDNYEQQYGLRKRKRKAKDLDTFRRAVSAIISELAISALTEDSRGFRLYRSNGKLNYRSRYRTPVTTKVLPYLLDLICDPVLRIAKQDLGRGATNAQGLQTVVWPSPEFTELLSLHGLCADDFGEVEAIEPIELKGKKEFRDSSAPRVDYADSAKTRRFREQMRDINQNLAIADLAYTGPNRIDVNRRQLRRIFTRYKFSSGGRLYGGFWQPMNKVDRLRHIRINGEEVAELDYGQIMPRLVYSIAEAQPDTTDIYEIPGFSDYRTGIKRVMSSMLFLDKPMTKFPRGTRDLFPSHIRATDVVEAVMEAHPAIAPFFFKGIGHRCQFLESQIMVEVLRITLGMDDVGGVALPIHDAILVPASGVNVAKNVMTYTFWLKTGLEGVVDVLTAQDFEDTLAEAA